MNRKAKRWYPGIYEGKTSAQALSQVGSSVSQTPRTDTFTPRSMRVPSPKTFALRKDGKLMQSLNGLPS